MNLSLNYLADQFVFNNLKNMNFLDIGANDGIKFSNTYLLVCLATINAYM